MYALGGYVNGARGSGAGRQATHTTQGRGRFMPEQVHGHEVMAMMIQSGKAYTRDSLRADIVERFGKAARFCTCSADNMTPDELITFLQARGKFVDGDGGFKTDQGKICDH